MTSLVFLVLPTVLATVAASCQPIAVDLCHGTGYNYTGTPNLVGHETQADAEFTLQTFSPLVQYGCSGQLSFFLCSVYVPMCNEKVPVPIGPCRGLCEAVKARCYPVLQGFGFPWPAALDCSRFPERNDHEHMCMEGPGETDIGISAAIPRNLPPPFPPDPDQAPCAHYARPGMYVRSNRSRRCLQLCRGDVLFSPADKSSAECWITVMSSLCFVTSLFAVLTFLGDPGSRNSRWPYPDRPLPFLALCYNMVSIGWGLRAVLGREEVSCYPDPRGHSSQLLLAQQGLGNAHCALVFFLIFFFGNAIAVWWIMLMTCWFLSLGLGWTHDRILPHAPLLHLLSWGVPACLTIAVLILRYVDAEELTGICSVGNHNPESLLLLVIAPSFTCLVLGASMLLLTLMSRQGGWSSHRTLLATLYILPSAATVASHLYQYCQHDDWVLALPPSPTPRTQPHANLYVFLLRSILSLSVGTVLSIWLCLPKSVTTLKTVFCPETHKKPAITPASHGFYYYQQPVKVQRCHRKHKGKNGGETLV
ncbi:frizzled-4-like [Macrosteles quadrilineatus]|uniref:frizzled-4-like n=1 Tax=Macrosteles quadrilineatus TaxID=74068 RepID=UPI0023E155F2|nr:frizzled-4-like [Macrosteles quadrilineatus]